MATIRTVNEKPVYSRTHPHQMSAKDLVEKEIRIMLREEIIREARSLYNSLIGVVIKKRVDKFGPQKQLNLGEGDREKTEFSVNSGKYEFFCLKFGLRNSLSIFQRTLDDILRIYIGLRCHVYIDDIIIFSADAVTHLGGIKIVIKKTLIGKY